MKFLSGHPSRLIRGLTAGVAVGILTSSAWAAGITISAASVAAAPGSSMDSFDVTLTNLGPSTLTIGGFSFGLSIANPDISFTDINTSTALSYIFSGNSLFGPELSGSSNGQNIAASDVVFTPHMGTTINSGGAVGLGHVLFNVSRTATPGAFAVNFAAFPGTTLSDASGNDVRVDTLSPGLITITGEAAVPEPSTFVAVGLLLIAGAHLLRRRSDRTEGRR